MQSTPPVGEEIGAAPRMVLHRAGTLAYTRKSLVALFCALLLGDVALSICGQIGFRFLPVILHADGVGDRTIALIASSIPSFLTMVVNPWIGYRSDRTRTRWGRRLPYLFWGVPCVTVSILVFPFLDSIAHRFGPVWVFGAAMAEYQFFLVVVTGVYFALFRDVVPSSHLGRFLSLYRLVGALAGFGLNYWLFGLTLIYPHALFGVLGALMLGCFGLLCLLVREGEYPPVTEPRGQGRSMRIFFEESFSHPIYVWTYVMAAALYAVLPLSLFVIFFAREELGIALGTIGKIQGWPGLIFAVLAYPIGRAIDRYGSIAVIRLALWAISAAYIASFLAIRGPGSFLLCSLFTGSLTSVVMLALLALLQQIYAPDRMGQLCGVNAGVTALCSAAVVSPVGGWYLARLAGFHLEMMLPFVGQIPVARYRFVFLMLALLHLAALFGLQRVFRHWRLLGGPANYRPPL